MTDARKKAANRIKISYLDGIRLHRALVAGIQEVISRQDYLNRINVFPVPDRDTGTNMALTLNTIIEETSQDVDQKIGAMLDQVADAALNGARGNSGAILAQFFQGLSEGAAGMEKMDTAGFVQAVNKGAELARSALSEPKEGTILTVISAFGEALQQHLKKEGGIEFITLLEPSIQYADAVLKETSNQLPEMRKAKVVDAGAQGFVDLLHGIYDFICHGQVRGFYDNLVTPVADEVEEHIHEFLDTTYRYCTECLIKGEDIEHELLRADLTELGNCLIVAGSSRKTKIHMHCNEPARLFQICRQYGNVVGEKADDMLRQQKTINQDKAKIAILTDSGADIPDELMEKLDIHVVPILINFGTESFIDKVSMGPKQFYQELRTNPEHPTTSQPSFGDFNRAYQFINTHYESIIAIHLPKKVSGTLNSSASAAKRIYNHPVSIVDSMNATAAMGLVVSYAAEAAQAGMHHNQILRLIQAIIPKTALYAAIPDMRWLVRGGRISAAKKRLVDMMRLTPLIGFNSTDGTVKTQGVLTGRKGLPNKMLSFIQKKIKKGKKYRVVVIECDCPDEGKKLESLILHNISQLESCHVVPCGAALGAHAGPGSIGIALQEYIPPKELLATLKSSEEAVPA
ncbi:MAG: DegV family protein [Coxiellaceae bacterium]|nr:DegV family protein [Coxiellaceae bacterium]